MKLTKHKKPVIKPIPDFSTAKPNSPATSGGNMKTDKTDIIMWIVFASVSIIGVVFAVICSLKN